MNLTPNDIKLLQKIYDCFDNYYDGPESGGVLNALAPYMTPLQNLIKRAQKGEARYRIQGGSSGPTDLYWNRASHRWTPTATLATIYTEAERTEFLNKELRGQPNGFPQGGVWVRLNEEAA